MSGIGTVVKVVDSHLCGWGSIPGKSCSFSKSYLCVKQYAHIGVWMFIKSFCYHYIMEKPRNIFTIIGLATGYLICYQIKTNIFIIIVVYSFIQ